MKLISSEHFLDWIDNIIHKETQQHENQFDLTVAQIDRLTEPGSLDFGGSEFTPAEASSLNSKKGNPDDSYGWWELKMDSYKAVFNESVKVPDKTIAVISTHPHAEKAGISMNSVFITAVDELQNLEINFQVPAAGCRIKENARIATLRYLDIS